MSASATYETAEQLPAEVRVDLSDWLLALADNKQVLGLRYAEWCTGAPELEANIALSAMAQYELGHARLLRGVLSDLQREAGSAARAKDAAEWRSVPPLDRPLTTWTHVVVVNALVDQLLTVNMIAAADGGFTPLAQRLRKAVSEEHYHFVHAKAWFRRLADGPDEIAAALEAAVVQIWPHCLAWFGPGNEASDGSLDGLVAAGVIGGPAAAMRSDYVESIHELFQVGNPSMATAAAAAAASFDWTTWRAESRRQGVPDFDAESFAMITGAHARAMGVTD